MPIMRNDPQKSLVVDMSAYHPIIREGIKKKKKENQMSSIWYYRGAAKQRPGNTKSYNGQDLCE